MRRRRRRRRRKTVRDAPARGAERETVRVVAMDRSARVDGDAVRDDVVAISAVRGAVRVEGHVRQLEVAAAAYHDRAPVERGVIRPAGGVQEGADAAVHHVKRAARLRAVAAGERKRNTRAASHGKTKAASTGEERAARRARALTLALFPTRSVWTRFTRLARKNAPPCAARGGGSIEHRVRRASHRVCVRRMRRFAVRSSSRRERPARLPALGRGEKQPPPPPAPRRRASRRWNAARNPPPPSAYQVRRAVGHH
jgi:hypothetical protein